VLTRVASCAAPVPAVEEGYDYLAIRFGVSAEDGAEERRVEYRIPEYARGPDGVAVDVGDEVQWQSDLSHTAGGWEMCAIEVAWEGGTSDSQPSGFAVPWFAIGPAVFMFVLMVGHVKNRNAQLRAMRHRTHQMNQVQMSSLASRGSHPSFHSAPVGLYPATVGAVVTGQPVVAATAVGEPIMGVPVESGSSTPVVAVAQAIPVEGSPVQSVDAVRTSRV
jgi:hypothetical protein